MLYQYLPRRNKVYTKYKNNLLLKKKKTETKNTFLEICLIIEILFVHLQNRQNECVLSEVAQRTFTSSED